MHHFQIYRHDPDADVPPRIQTLQLDVDAGDRILLDVLMKLKALDPS